MSTLHVTRALAKSLKLPEQTSKVPGASGSALGPWSLKLVHCRPAKFAVAVSTTTRWALALHAAPLATLKDRFGPALLLNLLAIGVPPDRARAEVDAHSPIEWALGHDRSVLTHLNYFANDVLWDNDDGMSLASINQRLADHILLKPKTGVASAEVLRVLGCKPNLRPSATSRMIHALADTRELMQAQAGKAVVTMPVLRLLGSERLEAGRQADMLLDRLPVANDRTLASGRAPRWVPGELVLDLEGIEAVGPVFAATLYAEALRLGLQRLTLRNAREDVAAQLMAGQQ